MPKLARPARAKSKRSAEKGKRYPLNMRTTAAIREKLVESAAASGRSLAQEVEARLEASFRREQELADVVSVAFGGKRPAALLRALGAIAESESGDRSWLDDPVSWNSVMEAWRVFLEQAAPPRIDGLKWALEAWTRAGTGRELKKALRPILRFIEELPPDLEDDSTTEKGEEKP